MNSIYSEVSATFSRDRVLEKFDTAQNSLPFDLKDIQYSHNDLLLASVYNDSIIKLYTNYLYLIANAEINTENSPTSALSSIKFDDNYTSTFFPANKPTEELSSTLSLSTINELHYIKRNNTDDRIVFSYGTDNSLIFKLDNNITTATSLISGNAVEFGKQFQFSNVVSVDSVGNLLFVLDKGNNTLFKFDISGLINSDPAVERTSLISNLPGRFLLKTIGGKGKVNSKNKLTSPSSISIFNNNIYVLDNGNLTIKVFDLNLNFITSYTDKEIFNINPVSITVSETSDIINNAKIFILGKSGSIVTLNSNFTNKIFYNVFNKFPSRLDSSKTYNENNNFKKIISSPSEKNVLYVVTNKSVIKFYKTNLTLPIGFYNNSKIGLNSSYEFIDSLGVDTVSGVDNLVLCSHLSAGNVRYSVFKDENQTTKLYHDNFYSNYFSLSSITIKSQELVNSITINKTTEKLAYNHSSFFENINKKIYSYYNTTRVPEICTVVESTFTIPDEFEVNSDYYIGVNEPLLTDIINRPIQKLYNQQVQLFNILNESYLNTNPPAGVPEVLQSAVDELELPTIKFDSTVTDQTTPAGGNVRYKVTRNKLDSVVYFDVYTSPVTNTGTLTSDYYHIPFDDPFTLTFKYGVSSVEFDIATNTFYSGDNKAFDTFIINASGGVIDQNNSKRVTTITALEPLYTISLSSTIPTPIIREGTTGRFAVVRTSSNNTFYDSASVNIYTVNNTTQNSDLEFITTNNTYSGSELDFGALPGGNPNQRLAISLSAGTIAFQPYVSAVFFDISAKKDSIDELQESFFINIKNPSYTSVLGSNTSHKGYISEELKPISLTVNDDYPTNYNNTNKLSGVNIWYLLSANTTYQQFSASKALDVQLSITSPLTVYSPYIDKGAIYYDTGNVSNTLYKGSQLTVNIPESSLIIGKGGDGGTGLLWLSGQNFIDTETNSVSTTEDLEDSDYNHDGQDGGPAFSLSGFNYFTITNAGSVFGGAGGGGAGYLAVSANPMPEVSALSASAPGGGGAGISPNGFGSGGVKHPGGTFGSLTVSEADFVFNACAGSVTSGGAGGCINGTSGGYDVTNFLVMSGAPGGSLGRPGGGDDQPDNVSLYPTCYNTVSSDVLRRSGGNVGNILNSSDVIWYSKSNDIGTGTFSAGDI